MACFECGLISFSSCILFPLSFFPYFDQIPPPFLAKNQNLLPKATQLPSKATCVFLYFTLFCLLVAVASLVLDLVELFSLDESVELSRVMAS